LIQQFIVFCAQIQATLTGAQAMATGKYHAAIVCNSDALEEQCVRAGRKSGELGAFMI